jgi:hypothetical protein
VKKPIGRTKGEALKLLKASLGRKKYVELDRKTVIEFGRLRAKGGICTSGEVAPLTDLVAWQKRRPSATAQWTTPICSTGVWGPTFGASTS